MAVLVDELRICGIQVSSFQSHGAVDQLENLIWLGWRTSGE